VTQVSGQNVNVVIQQR